MPDDARIFDIKRTGNRMVLRFLDANTWDFRFLAKCEDELDDLIHGQKFEFLAFDLVGLKQISSTLLGILASLQKSGLQIELFNACDEIREVLATTQLERILRVS